jgi:hypothetical protein
MNLRVDDVNGWDFFNNDKTTFGLVPMGPKAPTFASSITVTAELTLRKRNLMR